MPVDYHYDSTGRLESAHLSDGILPAMNMTQWEPDNGSQMIYRTAP